MKTLIRTLAILALAAIVLVPAGAVLAQGLNQGEVVFGSTFVLESGETLYGDLVIFGGMAVIEEGATVQGTAVLVGGTMNVQGEITEDVALIGGTLELGETAVIHGDLSVVGGVINRAPGATIEGQVTTNAPVPDLPVTPITPQIPDLGHENLGLQLVNVFVRAVIVGAQAMLAMLFLAPQAGRVKANIPADHLGLGLGDLGAQGMCPRFDLPVEFHQAGLNGEESLLNGHQPGLKLGLKPGLKPPLELDEPAPQPGVRQGQSFGQPRVEAPEVELVEFPQVRSVGCVHLVEPLHEFVGGFVAELLVELAGQFRSDRHRISGSGDDHSLSYARRAEQSIMAGRVAKKRAPSTLDSRLSTDYCIPTCRQSGAAHGPHPPLARTPIPLSASAAGGNITLTWANPPFTLQSAPEPAGLFTNVPGAASPHAVTIDASRKFYRLTWTGP